MMFLDWMCLVSLFIIAAWCVFMVVILRVELVDTVFDWIARKLCKKRH
jgi:hypothetical protein